MKRKGLVGFTLLLATGCGIVTPIVMFALNGLPKQTVEYKVTNGCNNYVKFTQFPEKINKGKDLEIQYEIVNDTATSIERFYDENNTKLLVSGTDVKDKTGVEYKPDKDKKGTIKIPSSVISESISENDKSIYICIGASRKYTIDYTGTSSDVKWINKPETILENNQLTATYEKPDNKVVDTEFTTIKVGDKDVKSTSIGNYSVNIDPGYITGDNLSIKIALIIGYQHSITNSCKNITITSALPEKVMDGHDIDLEWKLNEAQSGSFYQFNATKSDITLDGNSIYSKCEVKYNEETKTGTIHIPGEIINKSGEINIKLETDLMHIINFSCDLGGSISSTNPINVLDGTAWKELTAYEGFPKVTPVGGFDFDGWYWDAGIKMDESTIINCGRTVQARFVNPTEVLPITSGIESWGENAPFAYTYNLSESTYIKKTDIQLFDNVYHINNLPIGYIEVSDYVNQIKNRLGWSLYSISTDTENKIITIKNNTVGDAGIVKIDFINQTITFPDYETFMCTNGIGPMTSGCDGGSKYLECTDGGITDIEYTKGNSITIDLKKYNIKIFYSDDKGYIPFEVYQNVIGFRNPLDYSSDSSLLQSVYGNTSFDFNGTGFYQVYNARLIENKGGYDTTAQIKKRALTDANPKFRDKDYMQYSYNLLGLTLDFNWGLKTRLRRNDNSTFTFMPNGAYDMLKDYHAKYTNIEVNEAEMTYSTTSSIALRDMLKEQLDDGVQTNYNCETMFSTEPIAFLSKDRYGDESYDIKYTKWNKLRSAKQEVEKTVGTMPAYQEITDSETGKNVAYITYDQFNQSSTSYWSQAEKEAGRELPDETTESNYSKDALRLTMWANKKIRDNGIKNVVIDLSTATGGSTWVEMFVASWLCGSIGMTQTIENPNTESTVQYKVKADIDGDLAFTANDYLPNDVKIFIITSSATISCGNQLAEHVYDSNESATTPKSIYLIGKRTGGGACYATNPLLIGANTTIRLSSTTHCLRNYKGELLDGDEGIFIDEKNPNHYYIDDSISENWVKFYQRDELNKWIWSIE